MDAATRPPYQPAKLNDLPLKLVQVHLFFRHGDRSPTPFGKSKTSTLDLWASRLEHLPSLLPLREYYHQEHPFGQLTKKGAEQARELGRWIKQSYLPVLNVELKEPFSFLRVRSTNYLRTHMTGWFVLEGLLESTSNPAFVPIHILEDRYDNLYHNDKCPRLNKLWHEACKRLRQVSADGNEDVGWHATYEEMKKAIIKFLELEFPNEKRFPWFLAVDTVNCALHHGDPLPEELCSSDITEVCNLLAKDYVKTLQNREICQLMMGRLLSEVLDHMVDATKKSRKRSASLFLYSGHDATIVPLSVALGSPWPSWPSYVSSISVELWTTKEDSDYFVRVLYDGTDVTLPVDLLSFEARWESSNLQTGEGRTLYQFDEFQRMVSMCTIDENDYGRRSQMVEDDSLAY